MKVVWQVEDGEEGGICLGYEDHKRAFDLNVITNSDRNFGGSFCIKV